MQPNGKPTVRSGDNQHSKTPYFQHRRLSCFLALLCLCAFHLITELSGVGTHKTSLMPCCMRHRSCTSPFGLTDIHVNVWRVRLYRAVLNSPKGKKKKENCSVTPML